MLGEPILALPWVRCALNQPESLNYTTLKDLEEFMLFIFSGTDFLKEKSVRRLRNHIINMAKESIDKQGLRDYVSHIDRPVVEVVDEEELESSQDCRGTELLWMSGYVRRDSRCYNGFGHCWERRTLPASHWW